MRAQDKETDNDRGRAGAGRPSGSAVAFGPVARLLALQRAAGNAAVARAVEEQRHEHDTNCGHGPSVQRSSVHDVLRSSGRPLDTSLQTEMEGRFGGADFSGVRQHTDAAALRSAAEIGAKAYTSAPHVVWDGKDKHTLAHELGHIEQQSQGSVPGTDDGSGLKVSSPDDWAERDAEATARRVMSAPVQRAEREPQGAERRAREAVSTAVPARPERTEAGDSATRDTGDSASHGAPSVQRWVVMGNTMYSTKDRNPQDRFEPLYTKTEKDYRTLWKQVEQDAEGFPDKDRAEFVNHRADIEKQLAKWVDDAEVGTKGSKHHASFGRKAQNRQYDTPRELGLALLGWVRHKPGRREEKELAKQVSKSPEIELHLNVLLTKAHTWVNDMQWRSKPDKFQLIQQELRTGLVNTRPFGLYINHFDGHADSKLHTGFQGMGEVLDAPEKYSFRDKVIVLHDLVDYFATDPRHTPRTAGTDRLSEPDEDKFQSTLTLTDEGLRDATTQDRGVKYNTRDEGDPTTHLGRQKNLPLWAGQSWTTTRMLNLGESVGGTKMELGALAWSIFSFWRIDFDHTTRFAYHTLHEVMDIAQNYEVPYNMTQPTAELDSYRPGALKEKMDAAVKLLMNQRGPVEKAEADDPGQASGYASSFRKAIEEADAKRKSLPTSRFSLMPVQQRMQLLREYALLLQSAVAQFEVACADLSHKRPDGLDTSWAEQQN
ncbi:eCIS core domain-containing protein [Streptomyces phaeochromogenes]